MSATRTLIRAGVTSTSAAPQVGARLRPGRDAQLGVVAAGRAPASRRRAAPAASSAIRASAPAHRRAYLSRPSAFIASCTAGRAATRPMKAPRFLKPEMSTPTCLAQLVTVKR